MLSEPLALQRGMSNVENEITFPSNPGFVFHDSQGLEAGGVSQLDLVKDFIHHRAACVKLEDQLHAIWYHLTKFYPYNCSSSCRYCLPLDTSRPLSEAEMRFFHSGTGAGRPYTQPLKVVLLKIMLLCSKYQ